MRLKQRRPPAPTEPPKEYYDRISVSLEDRTAWNLKRGEWTREKFLDFLKSHTWIKVGPSTVKPNGLIQISRICDVRFFTKDGCDTSCAEFEFA